MEVIRTITNNTVSNMAVARAMLLRHLMGYANGNQFYQYNTFNNVSVGFEIFNDI